MKTIEKENYLLIQQEDNFVNFVATFSKKYETIKTNNLIIQLSETINITEKDILLLLPYAEMHLENGTTFVVIKSEVDIDKLPDHFNVAPTLIEAEDILEMEEIQRDLGF